MARWIYRRVNVWIRNKARRITIKCIISNQNDLEKNNRRHKLAISGIKGITTNPTDIKRILSGIMSNFKPIISTVYMSYTNSLKSKSYPNLIQEEIDKLNNLRTMKENFGFTWPHWFIQSNI